MKANTNTSLFRKLYSTIQAYFEHPEFYDGDVKQLQDIFFTRLSEMLQISFDLQASPDKLSQFTKTHGSDTDEVTMGEFIISTIENDSTYILLNYYVYQFIQAYIESMKQDKIDEAIQILAKKGISENDLHVIIDRYQQSASKKHLISSTV